MVSEIPRVSVFGHCPYSFNFPYMEYISGKQNVKPGMKYITNVHRWCKNLEGFSKCQYLKYIIYYKVIKEDC